jgi:hypothetical protein
LTGGGPPRLPATSSKRSGVKASANTGTVGARGHGRARPNDLADHADAAISATPPAWSNLLPETAPVVTALLQLLRDA